jgi:hypothetical protein
MPYWRERDGRYSFISLGIAVDHEDALSERGVKLRHIDLDRTKGVVGKRQLRDPARFDTPFHTLSRQDTGDQVKFGLVKGSMHFFPRRLLR